MPVTARLLQKLHETLGDEATSDLFAWWEETATVNRAAAREVADLYFGRFQVQLDSSLAGLRSELRMEIEQRSAELRAEFGKGLAEVRSGLSEVRSELRSELKAGLANQRAELMKWMFIFWAGTVVPLTGLMITVIAMIR